MVRGILMVVGTGLVGAMLSLLLKPYRPELSIGVSLSAAVVLFFFLLDELQPLLNSLRELTAQVSYSGEFLSTVFRCLGISCLTELGADTCRDAGQNAIASKVELAGKVLTIAAALPMLMLVLNFAVELMT